MKTAEEVKQINEALGHLVQAFNATDPNANIRAEYDNATETIDAFRLSEQKSHSGKTKIMENVKSPASLIEPFCNIIFKIKEAGKTSDYGKTHKPGKKCEKRTSVYRNVGVILSEIKDTECNA